MTTGQVLSTQVTFFYQGVGGKAKEKREGDRLDGDSTPSFSDWRVRGSRQGSWLFFPRGLFWAATARDFLISVGNLECPHSLGRSTGGPGFFWRNGFENQKPAIQFVGRGAGSAADAGLKKSM